MKLKTLKDLDFYDCYVSATDESCNANDFEIKQRLRNLAKKHLEEMEKIPCTSCECCDLACQKIGIMEFFNIKNEKNGQ